MLYPAPNTGNRPRRAKEPDPQIQLYGRVGLARCGGTRPLPFKRASAATEFPLAAARKLATAVRSFPAGRVQSRGAAIVLSPARSGAKCRETGTQTEPSPVGTIESSSRHFGMPCPAPRARRSAVCASAGSLAESAEGPRCYTLICRGTACPRPAAALEVSPQHASKAAERRLYLARHAAKRSAGKTGTQTRPSPVGTIESSSRHFGTICERRRFLHLGANRAERVILRLLEAIKDKLLAAEIDEHPSTVTRWVL
jgi:hypothetical protein